MNYLRFRGISFLKHCREENSLLPLSKRHFSHHFPIRNFPSYLALRRIVGTVEFQKNHKRIILFYFIAQSILGYFRTGLWSSPVAWPLTCQKKKQLKFTLWLRKEKHIH